VTFHAAEVEFGHAGVEALEAACFVEGDAALFNGLGDALDLRVMGDPLVVGVGFVNTAGVRAQHGALDLEGAGSSRYFIGLLFMMALGDAPLPGSPRKNIHP